MNPDQLAETLKNMLLTAKQGDNFTTESLERTKKKKIGGLSYVLLIHLNISQINLHVMLLMK